MSVFLVFDSVLLRRFARYIPEGFTIVAGGCKMQHVCDMRNGRGSADKHQLGTLNPDIFDIGTDGNTHLLFEFSGQIVF